MLTGLYLFACTVYMGYVDADGDGYGDPTAYTVTTDATVGVTLVDNAADCDDTNAGVNPAATEDVTNGVDDDCDGLTDELPPSTDTADTGTTDSGDSGAIDSGVDSATSDSGLTDSGSVDSGTIADSGSVDSGTDSGFLDSGGGVDSGGGDSGLSDSGADTGSVCAVDESMVKIVFDAPAKSTGVFVWGEVYEDNDDGTKTGTNVIPQGYWNTGTVPDLVVKVSGTHARVKYNQCEVDSATWFVTFGYTDEYGVPRWSCYGVDSSATTFYGTLVFTEDGVANSGGVYYKTGTEGSGCERTY